MGQSGMDISKFIESLEKQYKPRAHQAVKDAVYKFSLHVLADAKQLCPVATGALVASGDVEELEDANGKIGTVIGFNTNYAAAVHEITTAHHQDGKQCKFLETALRTNAPKMNKFITDELAAEFGG